MVTLTSRILILSMVQLCKHEDDVSVRLSYQISRFVSYSFDASYGGHSHWFKLSDGDV